MRKWREREEAERRTYEEELVVVGGLVLVTPLLVETRQLWQRQVTILVSVALGTLVALDCLVFVAQQLQELRKEKERRKERRGEYSIALGHCAPHA